MMKDMNIDRDDLSYCRAMGNMVFCYRPMNIKQMNVKRLKERGVKRLSNNPANGRWNL